MGITIIGIDCAVEDKNVGLALATFDGHEARIEQVPGELKEGSVVDIVADWIKQYSPAPALLALDAPLGWPVGLRKALRNHKAGKPIRVGRDYMFRRMTDQQEFWKEMKKHPLDVGADRIARTAHAALDLLHKLRSKTGQEIPLAWKPSMISRTCAIEVYPAGTLKVHGIDAPGYKEKGRQDARQLIVDQLEQHHIQRAGKFPLLLDNADALDAVLCVLAGVDFLRGEVIEPTDLKLAKKEGWIWVWNPSKAQGEVR